MRSSLLLALLAAGCGGSNGLSTNNDGGVNNDLSSGAMLTAAEACADTAAASCAKLDACRVNGTALRYGDTATCLSRVKANCLVSLAAKDTGRTPANEEACATAYAGATCTDYWQNTIAACQPPAGTLAIGSMCAFSAQCQSAFCSFVPGSACGTCASPPMVGASCVSTQCADGQVCYKTTMTCQLYGVAGAACTGSGDCAVGFPCVGATASADGTCIVGEESLGGMCDRATGPQCDYLKGLYCSFDPKMTAGTCVNYLSANAGKMCGYTAGVGMTGSTYTICAGAADCIIPAGMNAGICVANVPEGMSCDTVNGPACLSPARCITAVGATTGTCALLDPTKC